MDSRRKKVATTYGKSSRPATNFSWNEDGAISPDRPRKQTAQSNGALKRPAGGLGLGNSSSYTRRNPPEAPADHSIFDDPASIAPKPPPRATLQKTSAKPALPRDEFDVPSSGDEVPAPRRRPGKTLQSQPSQKPEASKSAYTSKRKAQQNGPSELPSSDDPIAFPRRQMKPLQTSHESADNRATSAAPTPVASDMQAPKKPPAKPVPQSDIFDVPSSDDEAALRSKRKVRPVPLPGKSPRLKSRVDIRPSLPEAPVESDDSNTSKKRKLKITERKVSKKEDSISPSHGSTRIAQPVHSTSNERSAQAKAQTKRTKARTGPCVSPRTTISKGLSSPAKLHSMLTVRSIRQPPPIAEVIDDADETMYDVPEPGTPAVRSVKATTSGSITPRQQMMLNNLLDDSPDNTTQDMPSISRLQLTERRQRTLIGGLTRSTSDIPQTTLTRKTRLIDTLKEAASSSDEEGSGSDMEPSTRIGKNTYGKRPPREPSTDADMNLDPPANSQNSQTSVHLNDGGKVTYAKQRSYLEEANPEDGLLMSMDLDDALGITHKPQKSAPEDDEDVASQVRGIHELRRQGQNQKFQLEAQASIDDISGKGNIGPSVRRSAMLEFCTRMIDEQFVGQLLDSALGQRFLKNISSKDEMIFDFAATAAIAFILKTQPGYSILDEVYQSGIVATLTKLLDSTADIRRIAKERKTNMSKIGQETVGDFCKLVQESSIWPSEKPEPVSPQLVATRTLELLVLGLRKAGNMEALINETVVIKLVDIAIVCCERLKNANATGQDLMIFNTIFSILEAVSMSTERQARWSSGVLQRLVGMMPVFFEASGTSPIKLAIRLCMNLTNNKPEACVAFAGPEFVEPLTRSISHRFTLLASELPDEQRNEVLECLILSLGAMINLAEFSDQARASVVANGDALVDALVHIFLEGSERAAQADSMHASQSSVTVGYLTVLLGNLCLNAAVRRKVRARLPGNGIALLVDKVREFVRYNERVDRESNQFEGEEGRETWRNFTVRLMLVVEKLEKADG
ncbi:wings apart-like protein regulation of heterochromatin-domain-containing protein [Massariosphaeria phaeospora]|uniref:Wings apart-like protein regulation of heterochromatin-domain-containing protein n=1 Tax=Massariosphaeria phaeospora TaxID=100035 RepID=A0A7C8I532_9PLEO|nr:wings apart-like protein regulation of heterochromatin-domain-containing protein [Massariosphaeria phaeospora]